jgi:hypothetical protein
MHLTGVPHWEHGKYVENVPIKVLLGTCAAMVVVDKDEA